MEKKIIRSVESPFIQAVGGDFDWVAGFGFLERDSF